MIIYFSGTGNTRYCAQQLAGYLGDDVLEIQGEIALSPSSTNIETSDTRIIWMFPVYSWGIPPIVKEFLSNANINTPNDCTHHLVMTCGDDAGYTDRQWRQIICKRGFSDGKVFSVIMPNTYVLMKGFDIDDAETEIVKKESCEARLEHIANELLNSTNKTNDITSGYFPFFKSKIIYPWFIRYAMSPKPFHCTDKCNGCGLCTRNCPLGNIKISEHHPFWGITCAMCLRCYHICPQHAVAYGNKTANKGQYQHFLLK